MKRMLLLWGCIFALGFFSCKTSVEDPPTNEEEETETDSTPTVVEPNAPNVTFINLSAYKVVVCRDGLSVELATVEAGATKSVYVSPGTTEITFHFRYSYCVLDDADSGMVWLDVSDNTAYTYPVDSADIASDTVQVRIPAPKNPQFSAAYLKVANQSDAPISLYNGNTQQKLYGQEKYYIQPGHSGVYAIPPDAPFDGFKLGATPASATAVAPFYAVSGALYACEFAEAGSPVDIREELRLGESQTEKTFAVTFESNSGTVSYPIEARLLEESAMPMPTRQGHCFIGWYIDSELRQAVAYPYMVTADITLYAKWAENTDTAYTVRHFKQNTDRTSYTLVKTETLTGTTGAASAAVAMIYIGFTADSFGQAPISADGTTVIDIYYDRNAYTVTFDANDGTGNTKTQTFYYGVPQKLKHNTFINPYYTFIGWAVSATDNPVYDNQAELLIDGDTPSGRTLYATWFYTVTAATADSMDLASIQTDTYTIKVKGSITQDTLAVLADKMKSSTAVSINLDMTEATGLTTITAASDATSLFADCPLNAIALPETLETIGDNAFAQCGITSITIPASVRTIGKYAFGNCANLQSVEINGAETIGTRVFANCTNMTSVTLKSVGSIGEEAFLCCDKLESVEIDGADTIGSYAFMSCTSLTSVSIKQVDTIGSNIFYWAYLSSLTVESIGTIEAYAFPSTLKSLVINSVKSIKDSAFANCTNLTSVTIESADDLTITADTFKNCKQLATLTLKSVGSIGENAFHSHSSLSSVVIESVKSIGDDAFLGCKNLTTVSIKSVDTIGTNRNYVFSRCEKLSSVTLESVGIIGSYTFYYCTGLSSLTVKRVETIGQSAFNNCTSLCSLTMESVGSIGNFVFSNCTCLSSISIDLSGSTGSYVFEDCTSLSSVSINAENINSSMFKNCTSLTTVTIGKRVSEIVAYGSSPFSDCTNLTSVQFEDTENWWYGYTFQKTYIDVTNAAENARNLTSATSTWHKE